MQAGTITYTNVHNLFMLFTWQWLEIWASTPPTWVGHKYSYCGGGVWRYSMYSTEWGVDCILYVRQLQSRHCTAVCYQLLCIHRPTYVQHTYTVQYWVARQVTHVEVAIHTRPKLVLTSNLNNHDTSISNSTHSFNSTQAQLQYHPCTARRPTTQSHICRYIRIHHTQTRPALSRNPVPLHLLPLQQVPPWFKHLAMEGWKCKHIPILK